MTEVYFSKTWSILGYHDTLRAADCKYREFSVKTKKSNFFTFGQDKPFGELFTKITIKVSKIISFSRNPAKREMPCSRKSRHLILPRIGVLSNRS